MAVRGNWRGIDPTAYYTLGCEHKGTHDAHVGQYTLLRKSSSSDAWRACVPMFGMHIETLTRKRITCVDGKIPKDILNTPRGRIKDVECDIFCSWMGVFLCSLHSIPLSEAFVINIQFVYFREGKDVSGIFEVFCCLHMLLKLVVEEILQK